MAEVLLVSNLLKKRRKLKIHQRLVKDFSNPFEMRTGQFIQKFRLSKEAAFFLVEELKPFLTIAPNRLPIEFQVLTVLKLLGTGSFQHIIAEGFASSQPSISRYTDNIINGIVKIAKKFINFPTTEADIFLAKRCFYEKLGFPNTIGAIDCTHIEIQKPDTDDWFVFLNRKGKFSINVQLASIFSYIF